MTAPPPPNMVCLNTLCPEYRRAKANPFGLDPATTVCGVCGQPINTATTVEPPQREATP
jgi:hypothetical protein